MENDLKQLETSIALGELEKACEILEKLEKTHPNIIPIVALKAIIERGIDAGGKGVKALSVAFRILSSLAISKKEALESYFEYLGSTDSAIRSFAIWALAANPNGKELMKVMPYKLLLKLVQDPSTTNRSNVLSLLSKVAEELPNHVPADILLIAMLTEDSSINQDQILKIANTVNPIDRVENSITMDTLYLMNWVRHKIKTHVSGIQELIDEMQKAYIRGPHEYELVRSLISESCVLDVLLFLTPKRYRGHDIHQFNVGAFGLFILEMYVSPSQTLKEYIMQLKKWEAEDVQKAWIIAAFLHDHALPISYMFRIAPHIYRLRRTRPTYSTPLDKFEDALHTAYDSLFSKDLRDIYGMLQKGENGFPALESLIASELPKIGYRHKVEKKEILDHGILGAVNLTTRLRSKNNSYVDNNEIIKAAAKAIASHHLIDKVQLDEEPITFLLCLCDEIQEWGREIAFSPDIILETSSVRMEPIQFKNGKLLFENELKFSFEYPSSEILKETGFDVKIFKDGKNSAEKRLITLNSKIRPQKICFKITV
jgi:hypothetical protein